MPQRKTLINLFKAGVAAVAGKASIERALKGRADFKPSQIIAVGKAAGGMCLGALAVYGRDIPALVITKYGHTDTALLDAQAASQNGQLRIIESAHPIADENSLLAGQMLLDAVNACAADSQLLLLVSGGASALAESLPSEITLQSWQAMNRKWVGSGMNIEQINQRRKALSQIKGGKLLQPFGGRQVLCCAISDVEGDNIATIGSGIGAVNHCSADAEVQIIASNQIARKAVAIAAEDAGHVVRQNVETLYADVFQLSAEIGGFLCQLDATAGANNQANNQDKNQASNQANNPANGIYIWGGEPTIELPQNPGNGGRNQSLALALAKEISGLEHIHILVAGTDGNDGPTDAAGAVVNGNSFDDAKAAQQALDSANAGDYLRANGDILITGPTSTNVMDLLIVLVTLGI